MRRNDNIRLEKLEERLKDLERNVGAIMSELHLVAVVTLESYVYYREGYNNPIHMNNSGKPKMINSELIESGLLVNYEDKETAERLKDLRNNERRPKQWQFQKRYL